jgi:hypothetical protein
MPDPISADWLAKMKHTLAVDLSRFMTAGLPPRAIVEKLFEIPEVYQAFQMRADRRKVPPVVILSDAADYLDDGFHDRLVADLREIVEGGELEAKPD